MTKPTARPNPVRLAILGALTATDGRTSRIHKVLDTQTPEISGGVISTRVATVPAPTGLAANVSSENVDRLAARWSR